MNGTKWLVAAAMTAGISGSSVYAEAAEEVVVEVKEGHGKREKEEVKEEERLAVSYPERGITIGALILAPSLAIDVGRVDAGVGGAVTFAGMPIGARFGIIDDLEVHAIVAPINFTPNGGYGGGIEPEGELVGPSVGALYRFLKGSVEMGLGFDATIEMHGLKGVILEPSIPARVHIGKIAALDVAVKVPIGAGVGFAGVGGTTTEVGLEIPVAFAFDIVEPTVHLGANTGFVVENFKDAGHTIAIPLGVFGGYALPGKHGPLLDIDPFFRWPEFATPGAKAGEDKINAGSFEVGLEVGGFLYL